MSDEEQLAELAKESNKNTAVATKLVMMEEHLDIYCDKCNQYPIRGIRYKCSVCFNFNLCSSCEEKEEHPHLFLKIRKHVAVAESPFVLLGSNGPIGM